MYENQLRQAIEARKFQLIQQLCSYTGEDKPAFESLTLSELENEWKYYLSDEESEAN